MLGTGGLMRWYHCHENKIIKKPKSHHSAHSCRFPACLLWESPLRDSDSVVFALKEFSLLRKEGHLNYNTRQERRKPREGASDRLCCTNLDCDYEEIQPGSIKNNRVEAGKSAWGFGKAR